MRTVSQSEFDKYIKNYPRMLETEVNNDAECPVVLYRDSLTWNYVARVLVYSSIFNKRENVYELFDNV